MCQTNCTDRPLLHSCPWLIVLGTVQLTVCPYPLPEVECTFLNRARRRKETARIDHGIRGNRTDAQHSEKLTLMCGLSFTCTRLKSSDAVPVGCLRRHTGRRVRKLKKVDLLRFLYSAYFFFFCDEINVFMEGNWLFEQYSISFVFCLYFIPVLAYFPSLTFKNHASYI